MDGQYLICEGIEGTDLIAALMCDSGKIVLKVSVTERKDRKNGHSLKLIVDTVTNKKHSDQIAFSGHIESTGRPYRAVAYKRPVGKNFGMLSVVVPNQPTLTLVKGGNRDNGK